MPLAVIAYPDLSEEDLAWIQQFRSQHDHLYYGRVDPHFTFVFPTDVVAEAPLIDHVTEVAGQQHAFDFVLRRAAVMEDMSSVYHYVFLVPDEGHRDIVELHDALYTGLLASELRTDIPYLPHITVGNYEDEGESRRQADQLGAMGLAIPGRIRALEVVTLRDEKVWTVGRVPLG